MRNRSRRSPNPFIMAAASLLGLTFLATPPVPLAGQQLPPGADGAHAALDASPRHAEWVTIRSDGDSIRAWVVHPERSDDAPVVVVIHEIYGLTAWIRAVADRLAGEGFIAIAPDLITMQGVPAGEDGDPERDAAVAAVRALDADAVHRHVRAVAEHAMALPSARQVYGVVGFCWGGSTSFAHATRFADLGGAVVYYGGSPETDALAGLRSPVLGLYGGDDQRVNATIPRADQALDDALYRPEIFEGAGHGFLRQQDGRDGANMRATRWAWPYTVGFFRTHLGG